MRIIAGSLGGRKIKSVDGALVRPAMGKTRESLFSMLEARGMEWAGARVLDLFAGSGSLALEALSRGAAYAALVDNSPKARALILANLRDLGQEGKCDMTTLDVARFLRRRPDEAFQLVFLDPPYSLGLAQPALDLLARGAWLAPGAFVAAETEKGLALKIPETLEPVSTRQFGQTILNIWKAK